MSGEGHQRAAIHQGDDHPSHLSRARPRTRVVHSADCHVGADQEACEALTDLVSMARRADADMLVIAGDLFDDGRVPQALVEWVASTLAALERPVVLLPGNHDTGGPGSIYERFPVAESEQIWILSEPDGEVVEIPGLPVSIWGRPVIEHSPRFRPLAGVPRPPDGRWGIIVAHGDVQETEDPTLLGSPIYPSELAAVEWDYVALGHIPRFLEVSCGRAVGCYAGNTAGTAIAPPGAVVVDLDERGVAATWRRLQE